MKKLLSLSLILAAIAAMLFTGCAGKAYVPETKLGVITDGWRVELASPKDTTIDGLAITKDDGGNVVVNLQRMSATNSPSVITETGKAQALTIAANGDLINAVGNVVGKVVDGVVTIYGQ